MEPGTCIIEGTNSAAAYIDPGAATCHADSEVEGATHIYAHYPVILRVGGNPSKDMRERIRRPMALQGLTRKEARTR
eukprot:2813673-Heterocapsa_arctica.AAC.1